MNQIVLDLSDYLRNIDAIFNNNPNYYHKIKQIRDAKMREIQIGIDLCVDEEGKKNYLLNEINKLSSDLNTKFNRFVLMLLDTYTSDTKELFESILDDFDMDIEFDKNEYSEGEIQFNTDIKNFFMAYKMNPLDEQTENAKNILAFFQKGEDVPDVMKRIYSGNDFAKIWQKIQHFAFTLFQKRLNLNTLKEQYEYLVTPNESFVRIDLAAFSMVESEPLQKIQWQGTQKELGELFVELQKKNWIKEIPIESLQELFTSTDSLQQVLKPTQNKKTGENEFSGIFSKRYKPKFDGIKPNEKDV